MAASSQPDNRTAEAPAVDDGIPDRCLVCTVRGDWAHFRRIDRTVTKQTYRLPPRTTVAGLLAAVVGVGRDEYYDTFHPDRSAIGIEVVGSLRTVTHPSLGLGTNPSETFEQAGGTGQKTVKVTYPDSTDNRQIHSYEYVADPAYRLYVAVEDPTFYESLRTHLERGTSYYTPSLGLSELLATIETPDWTTGAEARVTALADQGEQTDRLAVDSAVPNAVEAVIPEQERSHFVERLPGVMEQTDGGRRTTEFVDYAFAAGDPLTLDATSADVALGQVGDQTVAFY